MKTLIVYFSHTNNNKCLALHLQKEFKSDILQVEELKKRTALTIVLDLMFNRTPAIKFSPQETKGYDMTILVAPIWAGRIANPMRAFLKRGKSAIKKYAFITLCGGGTGDQVEKIKRDLQQMVEFPPARICQLSINDLLPSDQQNKVKYTSAYRVDENDLDMFKDKINEFVAGLEKIGHPIPQ